MTNTKTTKRALVASVLSIVICFAMLIGSTFAWFTDSATTGVNTIKSGNFDVMLEMSYDGGKTWEDAEGETLEFRNKNGSDDILWEPGAEFKLPQLRIKNNGNLALKFKVVVSGLTGDMMLADVLDVNLSVNGAAKNTVGTLTQVMALNAAEVDGMIHGELAATQTSDVYEVSLKMQESADNDYMNKTLSGLCITVYATQDTVEWDSWTQDYDADATYSDEATIKDGVPVVLHSANATVSIPANILTAGQVVKLKEVNATAPTTLVTIDDTLISAKDISIVDADGNEITMPESPYTVTMSIGKGLDASKLVVYHKENKVEPINYDATSGIVTFTTNSFSPFTVIYENVGTIDSLEKFLAVCKSINADTNRKAGVVYKLATDIDFEGVEWSGINIFAGTFDGQGHTISNITTQLFAQMNGTLKDLKVANVAVTYTANKDGGAGIARYMRGTVENCEFSNITVSTTARGKWMAGLFSEVSGKITGCTVNGLKVIANGENAKIDSGAGGFAGIVKGGSVITDCTLNDVVVDADYADNAGGVFGKVGQEGQASITLKNITVKGLTMKVGNTNVTTATIKNVGGFIGQCDYRTNDSRLTIDNCHINDLDMTITSNRSGEDPTAGFISSLNGGADITNCSVDGKIDGTNEPLGVGGFLGTIGGYGAKNAYVINITDCVADVAITGNDNIYVGGFVAYAGSKRAMSQNLTLNFTNCEAKDSFYGVLETTDTNEDCNFTGCKVDGEAFAG